MVEGLTFLGLALVLEGALFALFPGSVSAGLRRLADTSPENLRRIGLLALVTGVLALAALAAWSGGGGLAFAFPRLRAAFGWTA